MSSSYSTSVHPAGHVTDAGSLIVGRPQRVYAREDFEFGSLLGIGALAQVVHVRDVYTGNEYALKILDKKQLKRFGKVAQVINEKDMLFRLSHPGIVRLYFTFQDVTWLYLALELCPNGDLSELIARKGRLPLSLVQFYTAELVDILSYLRTMGVAHRDIKPENIFITETGHLKLGDFDTAKSVLLSSSPLGVNSTTTTNSGVYSNHGLLRPGGSLHADSSNDAPPLNKQISASPKPADRINTFVGTAQYVSPEMLHDSAVAGFGSDLWALGCVVYQMLTGHPPFRSSSEYMTFQRILLTDYDPLPGDVPDVGRKFVGSLLTLEPQDRLGFMSMEDLKGHLFFEKTDFDTIWTKPPPLQGVMRLGGSRSNQLGNGCPGGFLDSSDEEEVDLEEEELNAAFFGDRSFVPAAPESPPLIRASTAVPTIGAHAGGSSSSSLDSAKDMVVAGGSAASTSRKETLAFGTVEDGNTMFWKPSLGVKRTTTTGGLWDFVDLAELVVEAKKVAQKPPTALKKSQSCPILYVPCEKGVANGGNGTFMINRTETETSPVPSESVVYSVYNFHMQSPRISSIFGGSSPMENGALQNNNGAALVGTSTANSSSHNVLSAYLQRRIVGSDEHILMSGNVLKRRFFGRNRILVVTDLPRLLVLEPKSFRTVCEIPLVSSAPGGPYVHSAESANETDYVSVSSVMTVSGGPNPVGVRYMSPFEFWIQTESHTWHCEVKDGTAQAWVSLIHTLSQKAIRTANSRLRIATSEHTSQKSSNMLTTQKILNRADFGSTNVLGSTAFGKGQISADILDNDAINAAATARAQEALKKLEEEMLKQSSSSSENSQAAAIEAVLRDNLPPRERKSSSSCSIM